MRNIGKQKIPLMTLSRVLDVSRVDIDSQIIGAGKMVRVGAR